MPFRALFTLASADLYLHGPGKDEEKIAAAVFSLLAVLINIQVVYILAELGWFAVFVRAWESPPSSAPPVAATSASPLPSAAPAPAAGLPPVPPALKQAVDASLVLFRKNMGATTSDGDAWTVSSSKDDLTVYSAPYAGQSFLRWKVEINNIYGSSEGIFNELFDYPTRCASMGGWDKAVASGRLVRQFADGYKVVIYSTAPAFMGLVSGREFIDARFVSFPDNGILMSGLGLDEAKWKPILGADYPKGDSSLTRALGFPGGGFALTPMGAAPPDTKTPTLWKFVLVSGVALGGWLPQGKINEATASVLLESSLLTIEHLKRKFPRV